MQSYLLFHSFKFENNVSMSSQCLSCQAKQSKAKKCDTKEARKAHDSRTWEKQRKTTAALLKKRFFQATDYSCSIQCNNQDDDGDDAQNNTAM